MTLSAAVVMVKISMLVNAKVTLHQVVFVPYQLSKILVNSLLSATHLTFPSATAIFTVYGN